MMLMDLSVISEIVLSLLLVLSLLPDCILVEEDEEEETRVMIEWINGTKRKLLE